MQSQVYLVTRDMILMKGNKIYWGLYGPNRSAGNLKRGWLNRFMNRHPLLITQTSQVIKLLRAEVTEEGLQIFTWEFMEHVNEQKMTDGFIFNMDETWFAQKNKRRKVISATGSKNVWSKSVQA